MNTSCLCSHLPTHSVTAHPMVTIRISDRQRLIQPYVHNYAWLLFAALALYSAHLASGEDAAGERLGPQEHSSASTLRSQCLQLAGDCLMQAHQGKGTVLPWGLVSPTAHAGGRQRFRFRAAWPASCSRRSPACESCQLPACV